MTEHLRRRPQRLRRLAAAASIAVLTVGTTVACASSGAQAGGGQASAGHPLLIGTSLPMTGPVADVSTSGLQGYQLWLKDVNAKGGLLGRTLELKVLDNGFDPNQTGADYTRLISQDKVDLLLGTFSSLLNAPASAIAVRQQMLYVEPSGGSAALFSRGFTNLFFAQPATTTHLPDRFLDWVKGLPADQRPMTAAYLTQDDPSSAPAVAIFKTQLDALGVRTVDDETYDPSTSNFDTLAAGVAQKAPDLVIQGAVADDGAQFVQSLQKLRFSPKILFQTNAPTDETYASAVGKGNADGVFTAEAWSAQAPYPGNAVFVSEYTKEYGKAPTEDAANSYTAGQVLAAAVTAVGSTDQKALAQWLHTHPVDTIVGPLTWDATGVPQGTLLLAQWQDDALKIVAPEKAATTKNVLNPKPGWSS